MAVPPRYTCLSMPTGQERLSTPALHTCTRAHTHLRTRIHTPALHPPGAWLPCPSHMREMWESVGLNAPAKPEVTLVFASACGLKDVAAVSTQVRGMAFARLVELLKRVGTCASHPSGPPFTDLETATRMAQPTVFDGSPGNSPRPCPNNLPSNPSVMLQLARTCHRLFMCTVRELLLACGGYESKEVDGLVMCAFERPAAAAEWALALQLALLQVRGQVWKGKLRVHCCRQRVAQENVGGACMLALLKALAR